MNKIKELIEAGEKATQGEWLQSHRKDRFVNGYCTQSYTADGETICTFHWYPKPMGNGVTATYRDENAEFVTIAANARAEIKALYEAAKKMAEALGITYCVLAEMLIGDEGVSLIEASDAYHTAKQTLAEYNKLKVNIE